jgi:Tfp pilus assembly protein PilF
MKQIFHYILWLLPFLAGAGAIKFKHNMWVPKDSPTYVLFAVSTLMFALALVTIAEIPDLLVRACGKIGVCKEALGVTLAADPAPFPIAAVTMAVAILAMLIFGPKHIKLSKQGLPKASISMGRDGNDEIITINLWLRCIAYINYIIGVDYMHQKFYNEAIASFSKATKRNPWYEKAYIGLGKAYYIKGEHERSISNFKKAIEINPRSFESFYIGEFYFEKQENDLAIQNYTKAIEINPTYTIAYRSRGFAYARKGENNQAREDFCTVIELDPKHARNFNEQGNYQYAKGSYKTAIEEYSKAIQIDPNEPRFYHNRGTGYYKLRNYDAAIADFRKALLMRPDWQDTKEWLRRLGVNV